MSDDNVSSNSQLRARADEAIRALTEPAIESGEVITDWIVVAGTRNHEDGGVVITAAGPHASMPQWQARGLLTTALRLIDRSEDGDQE